MNEKTYHEKVIESGVDANSYYSGAVQTDSLGTKNAVDEVVDEGSLGTKKLFGFENAYEDMIRASSNDEWETKDADTACFVAWNKGEWSPENEMQTKMLDDVCARVMTGGAVSNAGTWLSYAASTTNEDNGLVAAKGLKKDSSGKLTFAAGTAIEKTRKMIEAQSNADKYISDLFDRNGLEGFMNLDFEQKVKKSAEFMGTWGGAKSGIKTWASTTMLDGSEAWSKGGDELEEVVANRIKSGKYYIRGAKGIEGLDTPDAIFKIYGSKPIFLIDQEGEVRENTAGNEYVNDIADTAKAVIGEDGKIHLCVKRGGRADHSMNLVKDSIDKVRKSDDAIAMLESSAILETVPGARKYFKTYCKSLNDSWWRGSEGDVKSTYNQMVEDLESAKNDQTKLENIGKDINAFFALVKNMDRRIGALGNETVGTLVAGAENIVTRVGINGINMAKDAIKYIVPSSVDSMAGVLANAIQWQSPIATTIDIKKIAEARFGSKISEADKDKQEQYEELKYALETINSAQVYSGGTFVEDAVDAYLSLKALSFEMKAAALPVKIVGEKLSKLKKLRLRAGEDCNKLARQIEKDLRIGKSGTANWRMDRLMKIESMEKKLNESFANKGILDFCIKASKFVEELPLAVSFGMSRYHDALGEAAIGNMYDENGIYRKEIMDIERCAASTRGIVHGMLMYAAPLVMGKMFGSTTNPIADVHKKYSKAIESAAKIGNAKKFIDDDVIAKGIAEYITLQGLKQAVHGATFSLGTEIPDIAIKNIGDIAVEEKKDSTYKPTVYDMVKDFDTCLDNAIAMSTGMGIAGAARSGITLGAINKSGIKDSTGKYIVEPNILGRMRESLKNERFNMLHGVMKKRGNENAKYIDFMCRPIRSDGTQCWYEVNPLNGAFDALKYKDGVKNDNYEEDAKACEKATLAKKSASYIIKTHILGLMNAKDADQTKRLMDEFESAYGKEGRLLLENVYDMTKNMTTEYSSHVAKQIKPDMRLNSKDTNSIVKRFMAMGLGDARLKKNENGSLTLSGSSVNFDGTKKDGKYEVTIRFDDSIDSDKWIDGKPNMALVNHEIAKLEAGEKIDDGINAKWDALSEEQRNSVRNGNDVNGIISDILAKGRIGGRFSGLSDDGSGTLKGEIVLPKSISGKQYATVLEELLDRSNASENDMWHEGFHFVVDLMEKTGVITPDAAKAIRKGFGDTRDKWEEKFVDDFLESEEFANILKNELIEGVDKKKSIKTALKKLTGFFSKNAKEDKEFLMDPEFSDYMKSVINRMVEEDLAYKTSEAANDIADEIKRQHEESIEVETEANRISEDAKPEVKDPEPQNTTNSVKINKPVVDAVKIFREMVYAGKPIPNAVKNSEYIAKWFSDNFKDLTLDGWMNAMGYKFDPNNNVWVFGEEAGIAETNVKAEGGTIRNAIDAINAIAENGELTEDQTRYIGVERDNAGRIIGLGYDDGGRIGIYETRGAHGGRIEAFKPGEKIPPEIAAEFEKAKETLHSFKVNYEPQWSFEVRSTTLSEKMDRVPEIIKTIKNPNIKLWNLFNINSTERVANHNGIIISKDSYSLGEKKFLSGTYHILNHLAECGITFGKDGRMKTPFTAQEINDYLLPCLDTPAKKQHGRDVFEHDYEMPPHTLPNGTVLKKRHMKAITYIGTVNIKGNVGKAEILLTLTGDGKELDNQKFKIINIVSKAEHKEVENESPQSQPSMAHIIPNMIHEINGDDYSYVLKDKNRAKRISNAIKNISDSFPFLRGENKYLYNFTYDRGIYRIATMCGLSPKESDAITKTASAAMLDAVEKIYEERLKETGGYKRTVVTMDEIEEYLNGKTKGVKHGKPVKVKLLGNTLVAHFTGAGGINAKTGKKSFGDTRTRWEYYAGKPKMTVDIMEKISNGKTVTVGDIMDDEFLKATDPAIWNTRIVLDNQMTDSLKIEKVSVSKSGDGAKYTVYKTNIVPKKNRNIIVYDTKRGGNVLAAPSIATNLKSGKALYESDGQDTPKNVIRIFKKSIKKDELANLNKDISSSVARLVMESARFGDTFNQIDDSVKRVARSNSDLKSDDPYHPVKGNLVGTVGIPDEHGLKYLLLVDPKLDPNNENSVISRAVEKFIDDYGIANVKGCKLVNGEVKYAKDKLIDAINKVIANAESYSADMLEAQAWGKRFGKNPDQLEKLGIDDLKDASKNGIIDSDHFTGGNASERVLNFYREKIADSIVKALGADAKSVDAFRRIFNSEVTRKYIENKAWNSIYGSKKSSKGGSWAFSSVDELIAAKAICAQSDDPAIREAGEHISSANLRWHKNQWDSYITRVFEEDSRKWAIKGESNESADVSSSHGANATLDENGKLFAAKSRSSNERGAKTENEVAVNEDIGEKVDAAIENERIESEKRAEEEKSRKEAEYKKGSLKAKCETIAKDSSQNAKDFRYSNLERQSGRMKCMEWFVNEWLGIDRRYMEREEFQANLRMLISSMKEWWKGAIKSKNLTPDKSNLITDSQIENELKTEMRDTITTLQTKRLLEIEKQKAKEKEEGLHSFSIPTKREAENIEDYMTSAAATRLAKMKMRNINERFANEKTREWARNTLYENDIANGIDIDRIMSNAKDISNEIYSKFAEKRGKASAIINEVKDGDILGEATKAQWKRKIGSAIVSEFIGGENYGEKAGASIEKAKVVAREAKRRAIKNATGMTIQEIREAFGGVDFTDKLYKFADGEIGLVQSSLFAKELSDRFFDKFVEKHNLGGMSRDEVFGDKLYRADFASTAANWMVAAARKTMFGRAREGTINAAFELRNRIPEVKSTLAIIAHHVNVMAEFAKRHKAMKMIADIDKAIDKYGTLDISKSEGNRKIDPVLQEYWKEVKKAIRMNAESSDAEIAKLEREMNIADEVAAKIADGIGSDGVKINGESGLLERHAKRLKYIALSRYGGLAYKSIGEISDKVSEISIDLASASAKLANKIAENEKVNSAVRKSVIEGYAEDRKRIGSEFGISKTRAFWRAAAFYSQPDLFKNMAFLFKDGSDAYKAVQDFRRDMSLAHIEMSEIIAKREKRFRDKVEEIYGKDFESAMKELLMPDERYDDLRRAGWVVEEVMVDVLDSNGNPVLDKDGKPKKRKDFKARNIDEGKGRSVSPHLSLANLIYIYSSYRQDDMSKNNEIYGRNEEYKSKLEGFIGKKGITIADWLVKEYADIGSEVSPVCEEITGMPLFSPDALYSPLKFMQEANVNGETRFSVDAFPKFLTRRVNHDTKRLDETQDFAHMFENRMQDAAHYIAFARIIEKMRNTFLDSSVQTACRDTIGAEAFKEMYKQIFDSLNGGKIDTSKYLGSLRNFVTATTLFWRLPTAAKQLEGIAGWSAASGILKWIKGVPRVFSGIGAEEVERVINTRANESYSEASKALKLAVDNVEHRGKFKSAIRSLEKHGLSLTTAIDRIASISMATAYFNQQFGSYKDAGKSNAEAKRMAMADLDYAINISQQSSRAEFLNVAQRSNDFGKMLTQFAGPAYVRFGIELDSLHRMAMRGNKKAITDFASRFIALHFVAPTMLGAINFAMSGLFHSPDDDEWAQRCAMEYVRNVLLGPLGGWFIMGSISEMTVDRMLSGKNEGIDRTSIPMYSKLKKIGNHSVDLVKSSGLWMYELSAGDFDDKLLNEIAYNTLCIFGELLPGAKDLLRFGINAANMTK